MSKKWSKCGIKKNPEEFQAPFIMKEWIVKHNNLYNNNKMEMSLHGKYRTHRIYFINQITVD